MEVSWRDRRDEIMAIMEEEVKRRYPVLNLFRISLCPKVEYREQLLVTNHSLILSPSIWEDKSVEDLIFRSMTRGAKTISYLNDAILDTVLTFL